MAQIKFWDAGSPGYRWVEMITNKSIAGTIGPLGPRVYLYTTQAIYDATIAVWNYKQQYKRGRPSLAEGGAPALLAVPDSSSYPAEHSAVAAAAAEVLAAMYPAEAAALRASAEEAGQSRVNAGLQYPSDHTAGAELGRKIGLAVAARAASDGSTTAFTTPVPTGKCNWVGTNPGNAAAIYWRPVLLNSASEFRPPTPPACDSTLMVQQTADVKNYPRAVSNFATNERAFYWQSAGGPRYVWLPIREPMDGGRSPDQNPPRAARVYALLAGAFYDSFIASQDGKFTYWYIRPSQLDTSITTLIPVRISRRTRRIIRHCRRRERRSSRTCSQPVQTRCEQSVKKPATHAFGRGFTTRSTTKQESIWGRTSHRSTLTGEERRLAVARGCSEGRGLRESGPRYFVGVAIGRVKKNSAPWPFWDSIQR